ncbi:BON domain-containing protein [Luteimonas terrae]|uniref:Osmotically-inducible protein OsmY n=1 Tax=Luteimonas terrae TaxID=1530191 RepID=A0ABU1XUG2_9GAMM|nr:BON domain-containing protein [Luteimonas terrae]MDR7192406.1 osmotically-inducible protein OsmY [Luteimonas terrae]
MTSNITRIPLAIAMSSVLAFAVGCSNDRAADDAAMAPASDPAMQTPPPAATPADTTPATPATGMNDGMNDGPDSEQPGTDTWITTKVKSSLLADSDVAGLDINVETVNGVVTLTGQVEQQTQIAEATRIAREIEGVTNVVTTGLTTAAAN